MYFVYFYGKIDKGKTIINNKENVRVSGMFGIPNTFLNENEKYITNMSLKDFINKNKNRNSKVSGNRPDLWNEVKQLVEESEENKERLLDWVDTVTKEGIKDVHIKFVRITQEAEHIIGSSVSIDEALNSKLFNQKNRHLSGNDFTGHMELVDYKKDEKKLSLIFCKKIYVYDRKTQEHIEVYPVFVDFYIKEKILIGRAKSKAGMYPFNGKFIIDNLPERLSAEKEIMKAMDLSILYLKLDTDNSIDAVKQIKSKLFSLLDEYTHTPVEIQNLLDGQKENINNMVATIMNSTCEGGQNKEEDIRNDVSNLFEKYFSITYPDKSIFMRGKAYPLKILATDDEESKVEQTVAADEPLQTKAVFFDNKKMIQKSRLCDGLIFCYNRINTKYATEHTFRVKLYAKKATCIIKFFEYVREEDIENVLFSVINAG